MMDPLKLDIYLVIFVKIKTLSLFQAIVPETGTIADHLEFLNGFPEGINGLIKTIKNTAYGYRNWPDFIDRIVLERVWYKLENRSQKTKKEYLDQLRSKYSQKTRSTSLDEEVKIISLAR